MASNKARTFQANTLAAHADDTVHVVPCAHGAAAMVSIPAPGSMERLNEDAAAVLHRDNSGNGVLMVADGLGGGPHGAAAAKLTIDKLCAEVCQVDTGIEEELRAAAVTGIERANDAVLGLGTGAGSTVAIAMVVQSRLRTFHVGDSQILLVGQRGKLKHLTLAHAPVAYAVEAGLIDEQDAMHHDDRHLLLNCVGSRDMRIEMGPTLDFATRDTLLLGTDGVFDNLLMEEVGEIVRTGPLREAAARLSHACQSRMNGEVDGTPSKPDDMTFILFRGST